MAGGFTNVTWVTEQGSVVWDAAWDQYLFVRLDDGRVCRVGCRSKGDKTNGLRRGDRVEVKGQTRATVEPRIVNAHARQIMETLDAVNMIQAAMKAVKLGIIAV